MFCEGGHFVLLPAHCAQLFASSEQGVFAYSILFSCYGLSSLTGSLLTWFLQQKENDPYNKMFMISALLNLVAMFTLAYYN